MRFAADLAGLGGSSATLSFHLQPARCDAEGIHIEAQGERSLSYFGADGTVRGCDTNINA